MGVEGDSAGLRPEMGLEMGLAAAVLGASGDWVGGTPKGLPPAGTAQASAGRGGLKAEGASLTPTFCFPHDLL